MTRDEFKRGMKLWNGGSRNGYHVWGCPCCTKVRVYGIHNDRRRVRRVVRHKMKLAMAMNCQI